jgi:altronate dehydratase large subunit
VTAPRTFKGYPRRDGAFGVRNHLLVIPTVVCANGVVERFDREGFDVAMLTHQAGCAQVGDDLELTAATLRGVATNPNVGAVIVLSLGCESNQPQELAEAVREAGRPVEVLTIQDCGGITATYERAKEAARQFAVMLEEQEPVEVPVSELVVGLECGGSDAWAGITANPALGRAADRLVDAGATVILAETPEIIGAEDFLIARAADAETAGRLRQFVEDWERLAATTGVDARGGQPTPGNQAGGLTTIEEKSLGAIQKGGASPVVEAVPFGKRPTRRGLVFMDTPGQDIEQLAGFAAGGAQVVCFTTGRGTPTGSPVMPVIKIASNSRVAQFMAEHIDVDAGAIVSGDATLDEVGETIYGCVLATASGATTASERGRHREFALPRLWSSL